MGDRHLGALLAIVFVVIVVGGSDERVLLAGAAAAVLLMVVRASTLARPLADRTALRLTTISRAGRAIALILGIAIALRAAGSPSVLALAGGPPATDAPIAHVRAPGTLPDIYLLLLDGDPRFDTLDVGFGYDSAPLASTLAETGFSVASGSRSNYPVTGLSVSSILDYRHAGRIPALERLGTAGAPHVDVMVNQAVKSARGLALLRSVGYELVAVGAGYEAPVLDDVDRLVTTSQITELDLALARGTVVRRLMEAAGPGALAGQLRQQIDATFGPLEAEAARVDGPPRFVFAHVPAPHGPMVFDGDGSASVVDLDAVYHDRYPGLTDDEFRDAYARHVRAVDERAAATIRAIVEMASRPAVFLVISDHGVRSKGIIGVATTQPTERQVAETYQNLFAWRSPIELGFGDRPTLVNLIPILANQLLGTDLPCAEGRLFASYPSGLVEMHDPDDGSYGPGIPADELDCQGRTLISAPAVAAGD
jgi:hypothetical protein